MVDCALLDLGLIDQGRRRLILEYLIKDKGVKPRDLGITPRYLRMLRSSDHPVTDNVLCQILRFLTPGIKLITSRLLETRAYFLILAEAGLRPGEPFLIVMDDVTLSMECSGLAK